MAKDPAFLFYSSDFLTGTMLMSDDQVGKYIKLMCLQHQKGKLTEKDMLNICKTYDEDVFQKFTKDEHGLYYNERLSFEIQRRIDYADSRRRNRQHKNISKSYVSHMENENENENTITNKDAKSKKFFPPKLDDVKAYFEEKGYSEHGAIRAFEYYEAADWHDSDGKKVKNWKQKMIANWFKDEYKTKVPVVQLGAKKMVL